MIDRSIYFSNASFVFSPDTNSEFPDLSLVFDVQIIGSSGAMFALNSSLLLLYQKLQKDGRLTRVGVERVSLDKIPASLLSSVTTQQHQSR